MSTVYYEKKVRGAHQGDYVLSATKVDGETLHLCLVPQQSSGPVYCVELRRPGVVALAQALATAADEMMNFTGNDGAAERPDDYLG